MARTTVRLSEKGEVAIPKDLREALHWQAGAELLVEARDDGILLKPIVKKNGLRLEDLRGFLKHEGGSISTEALCKPVGYPADWNGKEQNDQ